MYLHIVSTSQHTASYAPTQSHFSVDHCTIMYTCTFIQAPQHTASYAPTQSHFSFDTSELQVSSSSCPVDFHDTSSQDVDEGTIETAATTNTHRGGRQRQGPPARFSTDEEARQWAKERQKKDNHNQSRCQGITQ